ncbi:MAG: GvpL/GvpF family gas vesicle protein [Planctomycetes bacterium]|nr:GvpL/GvpF family gas vesicle protein [Planctomycetota bacterium]
MEDTTVARSSSLFRPTLIGFASPPGIVRHLKAGGWTGLREVEGVDLSAILLPQSSRAEGPDRDRDGGGEVQLSYRTPAEQIGMLLAQFGTFAPISGPPAFAEDDLIRAFLLEHGAKVAEHLEWARNYQEWRVALYLDPADRATLTGSATIPDPGKHISRVANIWGAAVSETLAESSVRMLPGSTRHGAAISDSHIVCSDASYLVEVARAMDFRQAIESTNAALAPMHLRLEYGGPFPPYRFAPSLDELIRVDKSRHESRRFERERV